MAYEYNFQNMTTDQLESEGIKTTEYNGNTSVTDSVSSISEDGANGKVLKVDSKADFGGVTFDISKHIDFFYPYIIKIEYKGSNIKCLITKGFASDSGTILSENLNASDSGYTVATIDASSQQLSGTLALTVQYINSGSNKSFYIKSLKLFKKDDVQLDYGYYETRTDVEKRGLYLYMGEDSITTKNGDIVKSNNGGKDGKVSNIQDQEGNYVNQTNNLEAPAIITYPEINLGGKYNKVAVYAATNSGVTTTAVVKVGDEIVADNITIKDEDWGAFYENTADLTKTDASGPVTLEIKTSADYAGNYVYIRFYYEFEKGEAVGGYYTDDNKAADDDGSDKIGIIRFYQEYKGNNNISQYGFYFVDSDGNIIDNDNYIHNDTDPYSGEGFYGDLINAEFDRDYYAKAFVKIGDEEYMSESIKGNANENDWFNKPDYNN